MTKTILGLFVVVMSAAAQFRGGGFRGDVVGRALSDLERAQSYNGYVDRHERNHFDQARKDLLHFADNWRTGRFDRSRLDGAIENIQHLVNANQVRSRDRAMLSRDLEALREFRSQGGNGGYGRYGRYPDGRYPDDRYPDDRYPNDRPIWR